MSKIQPELILIDVDGTLVDSVPDLAWCVDAMETAIGRPAHGEQTVRKWVGNGVERLVKRALTSEMEAEPDAALFEKAYPIFLDMYQDNVCKRSRLYPGVSEGLDWLDARGYRLGCITNKIARFTLPILEQLGVADRFGLIVCGDTLSEKKPHPMPLLHSAKHFSVRPENSMMLGDSVSDVKAARAARFKIICMSYGYNHGNDIADAKPDAVIDSFTELEQYLV